MTIKNNFDRIRSLIKKDGVTIIGVTKAQPYSVIIESLKAGITDIGESYVQEAVKKYEEVKQSLSPDEFKKLSWHYIGTLQTNKIKYLDQKFTVIHSIHSKKQLDEIKKRISHPVSVFFEVNVGDESSKTGAGFEEIVEVCRYAMGMENITPLGLMCIPPYSEDKEASRKYFIELREKLLELNKRLGTNMKALSMGMSNDFDIAVEEGATHVRIGTALYGERG